jgi:predicted nucleic acid-binding protein
MSDAIFLDSSFWITYRDEDEARHPQARRIVVELFRERARFVTTLPVACEICASFSRDLPGRGQVLDDLFANPLVAIEDVSPGDQKEAIKLLQTNRDKTYSLCDAISFVMIRRLQIKRAASFDRHFKQRCGFEVLP